MRHRWMIACAAILFVAGWCAQAPAADKGKDKSKEKESKKPVKKPAAQKSLATTYAEAISEGKQRMADMDYSSAEASFENALKLAAAPAEKGEAYRTLALAQHNGGEHKESMDTLLLALKAYPVAAKGAEPDPAAAKFLSETCNEALRISLRVISDGKLARKFIQTAIDSGALSPAEQCRQYLSLVRTVAYDASAKEPAKTKEIDKFISTGMALPNTPPEARYSLLHESARMYAWGKPFYDALGNVPDLGFRNAARARELFEQARSLSDLPAVREDLRGESTNCIAGIYRDEKNWAKAVEEYNKTLAMQKTGKWQTFSALLGLGRCQRDSGDKANARESFTKALAMADAANNEEWRGWCDKELKTVP